MERVRMCCKWREPSAHRRKLKRAGEYPKSRPQRKNLMEKISHCGCSFANLAVIDTYFHREGLGVGAAGMRCISLIFSLSLLSLAFFLTGCGADAPKPARSEERRV